MEKHEHIMPHLCKWEGGKSRDKNDSASLDPCPMAYEGLLGYHTVMGVTWKCWKAYCKSKGIDPVKHYMEWYNLNKQGVADIFEELYWDKVYADDVNSLPVANCIAQWAWGSGSAGALNLFQKIAPAKNWPEAVKRLNEFIAVSGEREVFKKLCKVRRDFLISISQPGSKNAKFQNGWMNRLNAFISFNEQFFK